jgi:hypothetical protein
VRNRTSPEAVASFLHGLLTYEQPFVPGGLRVVDTAGGFAFEPGCCCGLEDWRDWFRVFDGGSFDGGHDPWAYVECHRDVVRLTLDADETDGPFFDVPVDRLRELLAQVEEDLAGCHALVGDWLRRELPDHAVAVAEALGRAVPAGRVCRG